MIESTFRILPGVGGVKERRLWEEGILNWRDLSENLDELPASRRGRYARVLNLAEEMLDVRDVLGLAELLDCPGENWRLWNRFKKDAALLDIETTGMGRDCDVTVVSVHRGDETTTLVRGENLDSESLSEALEGA